METKEYNEGTSHALDDHPTLKTEDLGLDGARVTVLQLESVDDPHGQVAEQQKVAHVAPRHAHGLGALGRYVLRKMDSVTIVQITIKDFQLALFFNSMRKISNAVTSAIQRMENKIDIHPG